MNNGHLFLRGEETFILEFAMSYKVCFVNPRPKGLIDASEPHNLLAMATYVKRAGINVKIIDEVAGDNVVQEIKTFSPDLIGFTAFTCAYPRAVELLKIVKPMGYRTVIGGVHASALPEQTLQDGFDMVVVGEGERIFLEIITKGYNRGIFKVSAEKALRNDDLFISDRSFINMEFYCKSLDRAITAEGIRMATSYTSRGCPFRCIFCHNSWKDMPIRFMPPEMMLDEIGMLMDDYKIKYVIFSDDGFFINRERTLRFCELLLKNKRRISWSAIARPDSLDEELLKVAALAGCRRIALGFESGSQRILDILGKKSDVGQNLMVAELCHKYKIQVTGLILLGSPTETWEDLNLTWEFIKRAQLDLINVSILRPFPGTELWKECEQEGHIPKDIDFSSFYVTNISIQIPGTFSPAQIKNIQEKFLLKAYLINPKLRKRFFIQLIRHPLHMSKIICNRLGWYQ